VIGKLNELGYAEVSGGHLQLTAAGKLVADEIIARLV
jgi:hypothetical protein